mmetsp:Transcript_15578/g.33593  ORF Transcript_15578/g.33593 Transcript_15578/m.33593 type:complete len:281 (-) Transcript_15578:317-1159(-)
MQRRNQSLQLAHPRRRVRRACVPSIRTIEMHGHVPPPISIAAVAPLLVIKILHGHDLHVSHAHLHDMIQRGRDIRRPASTLPVPHHPASTQLPRHMSVVVKRVVPRAALRQPDILSAPIIRHAARAVNRGVSHVQLIHNRVLRPHMRPIRHVRVFVPVDQPAPVMRSVTPRVRVDHLHARIQSLIVSLRQQLVILPSQVFLNHNLPHALHNPPHPILMPAPIAVRRVVNHHIHHTRRRRKHSKRGRVPAVLPPELSVVIIRVHVVKLRPAQHRVVHIRNA